MLIMAVAAATTTAAIPSTITSAADSLVQSPKNDGGDSVPNSAVTDQHGAMDMPAMTDGHDWAMDMPARRQASTVMGHQSNMRHSTRREIES